MKIIDFRYRPSTRASLDSVIKNPVYCEYIKKTDFCSRPEKSLPECIDELRGLDIAKAVVSGRDIESTYAIQSTNEDVLQCMAAAPDLFIGFWAYDPHKGMTAVRPSTPPWPTVPWTMPNSIRCTPCAANSTSPSS